MSTITAVAPPLSLFGPVPEAPPHSLLGLLEKLPAQNLIEGGRLAGANVWMYPCALPETHDPCALEEGTFDTKSEGEGAGEQVPFSPFTAYVPMICSSLSIGDWEEFEGRLRRAFEARESFAVERELAAGAALATDPNPAFGDANMTVLAGGAAVSPGVALSYLEDALGAQGIRGIIHATPAVVAALQAIPFGEAEEADNAVLQTVNGNYVVSGGGYIDVTPTGEAAPGDTESWVFATGLVQVRRSPLLNFSLVEQLDRSDNTVVVRVERDYLAAFDPCVQAGVLVDWAT